MTSLYDLLRRIQLTGRQFQVTNDELEWVDQYLAKPDAQIQFKARAVGESDQGEKIYAQDYAIAGEAVDVFSLLTEAMLQNRNFASLVGAAHSFYTKHVPTCLDCLDRVAAGMDKIVDDVDWTFKTHKTT